MGRDLSETTLVQYFLLNEQMPKYRGSEYDDDRGLMQAATQEIKKVLPYTSFTTWLDLQIGRSDQIGKFAKTAKSDRNWPQFSGTEENEEYLALRSYLRTSMGEEYTVDRIATFEKAWDEFSGEPLESLKVLAKNHPC